METISKDNYLQAKAAVRKIFQDLSLKTHDEKRVIKDLQRKGKCFSEAYSIVRRLRDMNTVTCMVLSQNRKHLHADKIHSKMLGHQKQFATLDDQAKYVREHLLSVRFFGVFSETCSQVEVNLPDHLFNMMEIVAFSERPAFEPFVKTTIPVEVSA